MNLSLIQGLKIIMKKTLLAAAIPALLLANAASAVELYNVEGNTFALGGHLSAGLTGSDNGNTEVNSVSPRINIVATRDLGNGFVADAKAEWGLNFLDGGENTLSTRLGYLGLTHDSLGRAVVGTQWAPFYDAAGVADMPLAFADDFLYEDHYNLGTARAEKMVSYRNGFDLGNAGALSFGLAWQGEHDEYDTRGQAALTYKVMDFSANAAYSAGDVANVETTSSLVSLSYGSYGSGLYAAGVYAENENINSFFGTGPTAADSTATELLLAYAFANSLNVSVNYENVENDDDGQGTLSSTSALQVEYNFLPNVVAYAAYQVDLGNDYASDNNVWAFGGRIYL
ncbi:MAG: putative porin [Psychromonas sp.]